MRLAFLGTPDFAVPTLADLIAQGHEIAAIYSQPPPPRPKGGRYDLTMEKSAVHRYAETACL